MTEQTEQTEQKLESQPIGPATTPRLRTSTASHVGRVRTRNEDASFSLCSLQQGDHGALEFGLFLVADGMGGQDDGQWASNLAVRTVAARIVRDIYQPHLLHPEPDADTPPLQNGLHDALRAANEAVHTRIPTSGTTMTAVLVLGDQAYLAHVGDSRAYLIYSEHIERLTRDHSLVERLHELGQITTNEIPFHPQRNVLYRAIGQGEGLEIDVTRHVLTPGVRLLLCSDGLWSVLEEELMIALIREAPAPQVACQRLIQAALDAGGPDNITALIVEVGT